MLIDSHCHLTDDQYEDDRRDVLVRARDAGVEGIVAVCSDAADIDGIRRLLAEFGKVDGGPVLWGTAGIHPHEAETAQDGDLDRVQAAVAHRSEMVAVGETGLDFFYDHSPRQVQEDLFRGHLELAEASNLPVVVHSRHADQTMGRILREWGGRVRGVLHCYTGGEDLLDTALRIGWMVSFTGIITFKKYDGRPLVRAVPRERLMIETDGPYLAPTPFRGRRNEPAYVTRVAEDLAEIRGEDLQEVQGYTTQNAMRFFDLQQ
jgi:TatD DNase family protein